MTQVRYLLSTAEQKDPIAKHNCFMAVNLRKKFPARLTGACEVPAQAEELTVVENRL